VLAVTTKPRRKHPLRLYRERTGLSQARAAKLVGISQNHWCRIERGEVFASPEIAQALADLTGVRFERFLNFGDSEPVAQAGK
jgi:transcriptional regulator with XRE-family HTH domain